MKKLFALLFILFFYAPLLRAQTTQEKIWNLILSFDYALVKKDSATLKSMITEDFTGVIPSGKSFNKSEYIKYHCRPNIGLISLDGSDFSKAIFHLFNNLAAVNRRVHAKLKKPDGSIIEVDVQRLEVFLNDKGSWRIVSGQGTEVNLGIRP